MGLGGGLAMSDSELDDAAGDALAASTRRRVEGLHRDVDRAELPPELRGRANAAIDNVARANDANATEHRAGGWGAQVDPRCPFWCP